MRLCDWSVWITVELTRWHFSFVFFTIDVTKLVIYWSLTSLAPFSAHDLCASHNCGCARVLNATLKQKWKTTTLLNLVPRLSTWRYPQLQLGRLQISISTCSGAGARARRFDLPSWPQQEISLQTSLFCDRPPIILLVILDVDDLKYRSNKITVARLFCFSFILVSVQMPAWLIYLFIFHC